jgi:hypothetical protein
LTGAGAAFGITITGGGAGAEDAVFRSPEDTGFAFSGPRVVTAGGGFVFTGSGVAIADCVGLAGDGDTNGYDPQTL